MTTALGIAAIVIDLTTSLSVSQTARVDAERLDLFVSTAVGHSMSRIGKSLRTVSEKCQWEASRRQSRRSDCSTESTDTKGSDGVTKKPSRSKIFSAAVTVEGLHHAQARSLDDSERSIIPWSTSGLALSIIET